ncbi:MAG TPA: cysteine peptidase family C39 domain-containing protein, partial [Planctomycetota bacterium]|nr:cysteine peptidase family C39 domain-containing protein [Planctomycetota bacterium]
LAMRADARTRRGVLGLCVVLAAFGVFQASALLADPGAALGAGGHWKDGCYIQSASWSCAPAASVSLLRTLGIEAGEGEMARLMRSRARYGTNPLNIHHGLARKLEGTRWRAESRRLDYDGLVAARAPGIATVRLELLLDHAVAVLEAQADGVVVLDPIAGRSRMARADFEARWLGDVVLVREAGERS